MSTPRRAGAEALGVPLVAGVVLLAAACAAPPADPPSTAASDCGTSLMISYGSDAAGYASREEAVDAFAEQARAVDTTAPAGGEATDHHAIAVAAEALASNPEPGPGGSLEAVDEEGAYLARAHFIDLDGDHVAIAGFDYPSLRDGCQSLSAYVP